MKKLTEKYYEIYTDARFVHIPGRPERRRKENEKFTKSSFFTLISVV